MSTPVGLEDRDVRFMARFKEPAFLERTSSPTLYVYLHDCACVCMYMCLLPLPFGSW